MNLAHQHLLNWLNSHSCIKIAELERLAKIPKDSLRHFTKNRREIPIKNYKAIVSVLNDYGYSPLVE